MVGSGEIATRGTGSPRRPGLRARLGWRAACAAALTAAAATAAAGNRLPTVAVLSARGELAPARASGAYADAFRSVGYPVRFVEPARWTGRPGEVVVVAGAEAAALSSQVRDRVVAFVETGGHLVTALPSPLGRALGVRFAGRTIEVRGAVEALSPALEIRWRAPAELTPFSAPAGSRVLAWAPGRTVPLVAATAYGRGAVLYLGVELADEGLGGGGRLPGFLRAVGSTFGIEPPLASPRLTVYADLGDHPGADPEALAAEWYRRGIREVHLGTWQLTGSNHGLFEGVVSACHREGILVYAWLELPEVSTAFWDAHPEWREKTASGADARVDWRRLMALSIPECLTAVTRAIQDLIDTFDWDGVDLAELYFESPMGLERPDLFTPMNRVVRKRFRTGAGFDPQALFDASSPRWWRRDPASLNAFLAFRRDEVVQLHARLLEALAETRRRKPYLDLVVTLVDALYDTTMRDRIAVDTARITALAREVPFELQIEDPYTLWSLGPERYAAIAADYAGIVTPSRRLAVDVNVVAREGDVRPTAQQTGLELVRLVSAARRSFAKVCLYSEATVYATDWALLPAALAATAKIEIAGNGGAVADSDGTVELHTGAAGVSARLDGRPWTAVDGGRVLLPRGRHRVAWDAGPRRPGDLRLIGLNGVLIDCAVGDGALAVRYQSPARASLRVSFRPGQVTIDGVAGTAEAVRTEDGFTVAVPAGEHVARLSR